jgi:DNA-binding PadR family transcriptional regulator
VTSRPTSPEELAPLSPQVFHVLLALADRPRHGYGILLEVEERTAGATRLGTGTLYSIVKRLRTDGWIEETDAPPGEDDDPRRRHYRLTTTGRNALACEARRLQALVRQAGRKAVLPGATA